MKRWFVLSLVGAAALGVVALALGKAAPKAVPVAKHPPAPTGYPLSELEARDYANLVQVFAGKPQVFTTSRDASYQAARYGTGKQAQHNPWNVFDRMLAYQKALNMGFAARVKNTPRAWYYDTGGKNGSCGFGPGIPLYRAGLSNLEAVDAWGFPYCGYPGSPFGSVVDVAAVVLPYVPGVGTAASAGLRAAIALGQGKSLKDAGLAAMRGALPAQAQLAFDLGVSVATGTPVDDAAKKALLGQIPNGQQTYDLAVQAAKKAGVK